MMSEFPNNAQSEHLIIDGAGDGAGDYSSDGPAPCTSPGMSRFLPESKESGGGNRTPRRGCRGSWNPRLQPCFLASARWLLQAPPNPQLGVPLPSGSNGPQ